MSSRLPYNRGGQPDKLRKPQFRRQCEQQINSTVAIFLADLHCWRTVVIYNEIMNIMFIGPCIIVIVEE